MQLKWTQKETIQLHSRLVEAQIMREMTKLTKSESSAGKMLRF